MLGMLRVKLNENCPLIFYSYGGSNLVMCMIDRCGL